MVEQNSENIVYPYDSYGLFLGLISYPFNKDGKEIYKDLEIFFKEHKSRLAEYGPSSELEEFDKYLYKPAGYRMFGSQGLAVLSLVDDYAFPIRYFDKDHIQALVENEKKKGGTNPSMYYENFHSVVVMGVNEWEKGRVKNGEKEAKEEIVGEEKSLVKMAENTFLNHDEKTKCKYPFIGIIRLKINSQEFLLGRDNGIATIRKIRKQIDNLEEKDKNDKTNLNLYHIKVECFDNDEMTVLAFSDNLLCLFNFLGEIRSMKNADLEGFGLNPERHVFGSTLISFGYDVKVKLEDVEDKLKGFNMKCMVETKCGHRDSLYDYLSGTGCNLYTSDEKEKEKIGKYLVKNMTGGCNIVAIMPLERISELEKCCLTDKVFKRDIRRMKVVLEDLNSDQGRIANKPGRNHAETGDGRNGVNERGNELPEEKSHTNKMKKLMKEIGISKMVRDRMLSLYELYDNAHDNLLQQIYLDELEDTLNGFYDDLNEMCNKRCSISEIEKTLNNEIENMENAIYDRLHMQKHIQMPLEYTGGIQQYLTSFNYAYKKIQGFFNSSHTYVTITGAKRGSSIAHLFKLNINEILYPELFITLIWKEIANFALLCNDNPKGDSSDRNDNDNKKEIELIDVWKNLTTKDAGYDTVLIDSILLSPDVLDHDLTSQIIVELLTKKDDHELLKYFLKDYLVLHFAFDDDFKMMWHFYFKTLMQTAVSYESLNRMKRPDFIHMLLRLFIVALVRGDDGRGFVESEQMNTPFDSLISNLWIDHFDRTWKIAQVIYRTLEQFGFKSMLNLQINFINLRMMSTSMMNTPVDNTDSTSEQQDNSCNSGKSPNVDDEIIAYMKQEISKMSDDIRTTIENGEIVVDKDNPVFICSLFQAYMRLIYDMDQKGGKIIKCLPRDKNGEIASFIKCTDSSASQFYDNAIALVVDPTGGVFVSSAENRKKYFLYRTLLYRSLWNYRYADGTPTNKNVAK